MVDTLPTSVGLRLVLRSDAVLSAHGGTEGAHRSLAWIPGATLLGIAAGRLYERLGAQRAFLAFHSNSMSPV